MPYDELLGTHLHGFLPAYTSLGLIVWLLVLVAAVGFLIAIFKD